MKKILTLIISGLAFLQADAQDLSGGFRTGASKWMDKDNSCGIKRMDNGNLTWDKEFFIRYQASEKVVLEAGMGHYAYKATYREPENFIPAHAEGSFYISSERSQNLEWNLSAQYDMTCAGLQAACPLLKRIKSYAGVVLTPTLSRNTITEARVGDAEGYTRESSRDQWSLWTGLTHTLTYELCNQLYLSSAVRLQIDPNRFFDASAQLPDRNTRLGLQLGVGYNIR